MPTTLRAASCVFCEIIAGTRPSHRVLDEDDCIAFLDAKPVFHGHVLVVPRAHHETLADLPAGVLPPFFTAVQRVARAVEAALEADGTFVAMNNKVSQSVPHLHAHVVPRRKKDGLRGFFWPRTKYESEAAMAEVAAAVRGALV